nr:ABC transporter ATP-binding protein [Endobacter medicaginis]
MLRIDNLCVRTRDGGLLVDDVQLDLARGEMLSLVGESGSGKSLTAAAILRLLPRGLVATGRIAFEGADLLALDEASMRAMRGGRIGMVFQNPLSALNPTRTIGRQIADPARLHVGADARQAREMALQMLAEVGIPDPKARIDDYPHQFSGGMRQRVAIAMALVCHPKLLIADEPTTALDPIVAAQILELIGGLRRRHDMAVLFISHNLAVVRAHTDCVQVMYGGRTAERARADVFFAHPRHPYGRALLDAAPDLATVVAAPPGYALPALPGQPPDPLARPPGCAFAPRCPAVAPDCEVAVPPLRRLERSEVACLHPVATPAGPRVPAPEAPMSASTHSSRPSLLEVRDLVVRYDRSRTILDGLSFDLAAGECLGIVGESGSGKSTLGRAVLQMVAYQGRIALQGHDFATLRGRAFRDQRRRIQVVFQDPKESLNPRLSVLHSVAEAARLAQGLPRDASLAAARTLLERVRLGAALYDRLPEAISGGQAQRVAIARALAAKPALVVLDEPTSALDVSTQATLLNLLRSIGRAEGLAWLLISHDLAAIAYMADRIAVLRAGRIVELAPPATLVAQPHDPYTAALVAAATG